MPRIQYKRGSWRSLGQDTVWKIGKAAEIMEEYAAAGYDLTIRQLYYQFVSKDLIRNNEREYKKLIDAVGQGRMYGVLDWGQLVDRTRNLQQNSHWDSPGDIVRACAEQYRIDLWEEQESRVEVWVEKEALIGVLEPVCTKWDVPYFACKGYVSDSEMWAAGQRMRHHVVNEKRPVILHLGDHDPSGLDMTRDIRARLARFLAYDLQYTHEEDDRYGEELGIETAGETFEVRRIALNPDQIEEYSPPPNPAKKTDSRFLNYQRETGLDESWELDALPPTVISALIEAELEQESDPVVRKAAERKQQRGRIQLRKVADEL